jgi:tRNA pseudouridine55 synthase
LRPTPRRSTAAQLETALADYRGEIEQLPPMYSALKRDGSRCTNSRGPASTWNAVRAHSVSASWSCWIFVPGCAAEADMRISCSKGTYVRSLAMDIGEQLGLGGHVRRCDAPASGRLPSRTA